MDINKEKLIELLEDDYGTGYWEEDEFKYEGIFLMRRNYDHLISLIKKCEGKESQDESGNCIKPDVNVRFSDFDEEEEDYEEEEPDYKECMCCGNVQQSGMSCDKCAGPTRDGFL